MSDAHRALTALILSSVLLLCAASVQAQTDHGSSGIAVRFAAGLYDVRRERPSEMREVQVAFLRAENFLQPVTGFMATRTRDTYNYMGFLANIRVSRSVRLLLTFAGGLYNRGTGIDLGHPFEFKSEIEVGWQLSPTGRIGLGFSHISNGALSSNNPGLEALALAYSLAL